MTDKREREREGGREGEKDRLLLATCNKVANIICGIALFARPSGMENFRQENASFCKLIIHIHHECNISQIFNVVRISIKINSKINGKSYNTVYRD